MNDEYNILIQRLDKFIRKYYKNQVIRGIILSATIYLLFYMFITCSEYYFHFSVFVRTFVFYFVLALYAAVFIKFILIPVLNFFRIGKVISHQQAARIIASHFAEVQDRLLNILQLAGLNEEYVAKTSRELVIASIDQKIKQIKPLPLAAAVNLRSNFKYLKYLAIIICIITLIFVFYPAMLTVGTERIINHSIVFEKEAPFTFNILNDSLFVQKGNDFDVKVEVSGRYIPKNILISFGGNSFIMKKETRTTYNYKLRNINNSLDFHFIAEDHSSARYRLNVLPSPLIIDFNVQIKVPGYTNETDKILHNVGDLSVPCGSAIKWYFKTKDIDSLYMIFRDTINYSAVKDTGIFRFSKTFLNSCQYRIAVQNKFFKNDNVVKYNINVIPDMYPGIRVNYINDTVNPAVFYFRGMINDDYGFKSLTFNYRENADAEAVTSMPLPLNKNTTSQEFYYAFDFSSVKTSSNKIEYYFEIWDNDGINGSKSSRTNTYEYSIPSKEELRKLEEEAGKSIELKLNESMRLADELKKEINDLQENMINENSSSWEKTKMLEEIVKKHNELERLMHEISKENKQKNDLLNSYSEEQEDILEKQQQLEELMDNLLSEELKELIEEFNELLKEFDKSKLNELSDDMKLSYKDLSEQLDRSLELLKQYEVEQKLQNTIDELDELAKDQDKLSEKTKDKKSNLEDNLKEQQEQSEKFDNIMEDYKDIQKLNNELQNPSKLDDFSEEKENITDEFREGSQNMQDGKMNKASKNQKSNSQKLNDLSKAMENMMQQNMSMQMSQDIDDLRQIIDNVVTFSFDQENLMSALQRINNKDPKFVTINKSQSKLSDDFVIIKDSLNALAKRVPQLGTPINKELLAIEKNMNKALNSMEERQTSRARVLQQHIMTSSNNLALLLSEVLQSLQSQMASQMQGMQQCQKPGCGKPSLSNMRMQQESLKSQLENMIKQLKDGGDQFDKRALNKKLMQMLAQQETFRKMLSDMINGNSVDPETQKKLNEIKNLIENNENDLINKNITPKTLQRQNLIVTRLLEAENSEYEREVDKKRESKEGKNDYISNPEEIFQYKGMNLKFNELLNSSNIKLYRYYKEKYKDYLMKLNEE